MSSLWNRAQDELKSFIHSFAQLHLKMKFGHRICGMLLNSKGLHKHVGFWGPLGPPGPRYSRTARDKRVA